MFDDYTLKQNFINILYYSKKYLLLLVTTCFIFNFILITELDATNKTSKKSNKKTLVTNTKKHTTNKNITKTVPKKKVSSTISKKNVTSRNKKLSSAKNISAKSRKSSVSRNQTSSKSKKYKSSKGKIVASKRGKYSTAIDTVTDTLITNGIRYKNLRIKSGYVTHNVHIIESDLTNDSVDIKVLKSGNRIDGLDMVPIISRLYDSCNSDSRLYAAINANFWQAYSLNPIGPTIIDGELVEMRTHKRWSATFFDEKNLPYIDNYFIDGKIIDAHGHASIIDNVNKRKDSNGVILYNKYCGGIVPYVPSKTMAKAFKEADLDTNYVNDMTEDEINIDSVKNEVETSMRSASIEYSLHKAVLKYTTNPAINKLVSCVVIKVDTGSVEVPKNGCLISYGKDVATNMLPHVGDTLKVDFSTNVNQNIQFVNSVAGTPRLVRKGVRSNEAYLEGSHGRRFINKPLPRTCIGYNKNKSKLYLVAVESPNSSNHCSAANLDQMSFIMQRIGSYDAMNLDGGGSTTMVLGGNNLIRRSSPSTSRRVSVALAITKKK